MNNTTLVKTLVLFSAQELEELETFVQSPFFNNGSHFNPINRLFSLLQEAVLNDAVEVPNQETVAQLISEAGKPVSKRYVDNLIAELLGMVRQYIAWKGIQHNWGPAQEELLNAQFYQQRGALNLKERTLKRARKTLDKELHHPLESPLLWYYLEDSFLKLKSLRNNRQGDLNLPATIENLTLFYATKLLDLSMLQMQQKRVYPDYKPKWDKLLRETRAVFRSQRYFNDPTVQLMDEAILLFEQTSGQPLQQIESFLQLFDEYQAELPEPILKSLATFARNFCTWQCNIGQMDLYPLYFQLYRDHFERGWLYVNGKIPQSVFLNLVTSGLREKEFEWVKHIIEDHKDKVEGEDREKLLHYSKALYYLTAGDLDKAHSHFKEMLSYPKFNDTNWNSLVYTLEIKIYYYKGEHEQLSNCLNNYRMYLRRNDRYYDQDNRERKFRFIQLVRQLTELQRDIRYKLIDQKEATERLTALKEELSAPQPVTERWWLLGEVGGIEV